VSARLNVKVAATEPAVAWIWSSVAMSMLLTTVRRVNPVPAVIVPKEPESSMATPKSRSPLTVVVAAVLVTPLVAVVPVARFLATTSNGEVVAMPLYSLTMIRRKALDAPRVTVTVFAPGRMLGA
jgi:hypothetical protein